MNVRRAMILAAGYGTRMLPATKVVPKEMLPLVDRPIIEYILDEVVESGIEQVVIVTSAGKRTVEDHFGPVHHLEQLLEAKSDADTVRRLERVRRASGLAKLVFVRQHTMGGIAHAVQSARHAIGEEPFVLILPDDVIVADPPVTRQLLDVYERFNASVVSVQPVPRDRVSSYGVISPKEVEPGIFQVQGLVEKPPVDQAPSNLTIIGRYVFTPAIFEAIARTRKDSRGELQITDAMQHLLSQEALYARELQGQRYDTGQPLGYIQAGIELMLRRPEYAPHLRAYLDGLVQSDLYRVQASSETR